MKSDPPTTPTSAAAPLDDHEAAWLEQASQWHVRIAEDPGVAQGEEFLAWHAEPQHRRAFDEVAWVWQLAAAQPASERMMEMRRAAITDAQRAAARRMRSRRWPMALAAGVLLAVLTSVGLWFYPPTSTYATAIGERRVISLADGSRLSMDSDSVVKVRYTANARMLTLERGRARFDVAHLPARPFTVDARSERVLALGTVFHVERLADKVLVTLIEGKVRVGPSDAPRSADSNGSTPRPQRSIVLEAGEQLIAGASEPIVKVANLRAATAWESGRLEFYDEPLGEAVARVNRYATNPIEVAAEIAQLRVSGVFHAGDVNGFVDAVTAYFPVAAAADRGRVTLYPVSP